MSKRAPRGSKPYLKGQCHTFAIALHNEFGYNMYALEDRNREIYNERTKKSYPFIAHTFAKKGDKAVDAIGVRSIKSVEKDCRNDKIKPDWKVHRIDQHTVTKHPVYKATYNKVSKTGVQKAERYIRKNKERYD